QRLPELISYHLTTAPEWELAKLSKDAGAELLRKLGVRGTLVEREQLARDVKGHALTLTLLGKYLAEAHGGDIRKRDLVSLTDADYEEASGHAFHVMEAYERWLEKDGRRVELAILNLLGLFDRPASPDCLVALRHAPAIPGLTETLVPLAEAQWNLAVKRLVQLGVVEEQPWEPRSVIGYSEEEAKKAVDSDDRLGAPKPFENPRSVILNAQSVDAHPLIREYFGRRLRETSPESWQAAHSRLFEHLRSSVPYWPEGLDGLQTLYQAVAHGCQAGRYQETCDEVYRDRILRGTSGPNAFYSSKKLGAVGADFAAVNCFFVVPLTRPAPELAGDAQVWLLSEAALALRALGRLTEARQPMQIGLERSIEQEDWKQVAIQAGNISELDLTLGDVAPAVREAEQSVEFADRSGDAFQRIGKRTTLADAQHQAGRSQDAQARFEEAEVMQRERHRGPSFLYSLWGFRFCDLLLADVERAVWRALMESTDSPLSSGDLSALGSDTRLIGVETGGDTTHSEVLRAVEQRTQRMFEWNQSDSLLEIGLDHLTLARVAIYRTILEPSAIDIRVRELPSHIAEAVLGIRRANALHHLPRGLLTSAWQWSMLGQTTDALADLSEAQQIAERGPMRLHLADVHLHRARLFFRDDLTAAHEDLKQARNLIKQCGYLRRIPELEDAEKVILAAK
ncbi:MAG TPA: hypothetical protein VNN08_03910, partial [Thermoanaerobaculia bacterium]|nr:hypothetical protein [Thermoanaerobaculia bacterium]